MEKDATVSLSDVTGALFHWFTAARAQSLPMSGTVLEKKASDMGLLLGCENFDPGTSWLQI